MRYRAICGNLRQQKRYICSWIEWNGKTEDFLSGSNEERFDKVCVLDLKDYPYINDYFKIDGFLERYRTYVIDHADILVDSEVERVICGNPQINWVLIGNYKPDFIADDAICTWKRAGNRFFNSFLCENE